MTIREIAQIAGVSVATVSLALNDKGGVKEETKQLILEIASQYGYNKKITENKKNLLLIKYINSGVSIDKNGDFIAQIMDSIEYTTSACGYSMMIKNVRASEWKETIHNLSLEEFCGVIFLATEADEEVGKQIVGALNLPIVAVDNIFETIPLDSVVMDNFGGIYDAVNYLYSKGHRRIGYLDSTIRFSNMIQRFEAYKKVMKQLGLIVKLEDVELVEPTLEGAYQNMLEHLKNKTDLPTAYVAANDTIAIGGIKALKETGIDVPDQISVVGFDDLPFCVMLDKPLTTMKVNKKKMGEQAVKMLVHKIDDEETGGMKLLIRPHLVERESVAPYKAN